MRRLPRSLQHVLQLAALAATSLLIYLGASLLIGAPSAHALPEYSPRTGEACAACHVSAAGGGPRTMRGLLWSARGRPDALPQLPGLLLAPGVTSGMELYDIACAGCHGFNGEGLFGIGLADRAISRTTVRAFIRDGLPALGMPAFEGQFTAEQLEALSQFVAEMGAGELQPHEYPLPPPGYPCGAQADNLCERE